MSPFQPLGDQARWRVVYEMLQATPTGDTLRYDAMGKALELDPRKDRHAIQMAVRRAAKEHERQDRRALEPVANIGYRVVEPTEHLTLAKLHSAKSGRALERARSKVTHVDLTGVEPEIRKAFEYTATALTMMADYARRLDIRQRNLEAAVNAGQERQERSESEIAELRTRLDRLEKS